MNKRLTAQKIKISLGDFVTRAIALDAKCLRDKCDADHDLGYELLKRFLPVLVQRLQATRLQMLDVYGSPR